MVLTSNVYSCFKFIICLSSSVILSVNAMDNAKDPLVDSLSWLPCNQKPVNAGIQQQQVLLQEIVIPKQKLSPVEELGQRVTKIERQLDTLQRTVQDQSTQTGEFNKNSSMTRESIAKLQQAMQEQATHTGELDKNSTRTSEMIAMLMKRVEALATAQQQNLEPLNSKISCMADSQDNKGKQASREPITEEIHDAPSTSQQPTSL